MVTHFSSSLNERSRAGLATGVRFNSCPRSRLGPIQARIYCLPATGSYQRTQIRSYSPLPSYHVGHISNRPPLRVSLGQKLSECCVPNSRRKMVHGAALMLDPQRHTQLGDGRRTLARNLISLARNDWGEFCFATSVLRFVRLAD